MSAARRQGGPPGKTWLSFADNTDYKYSTVAADMDTYGVKLSNTDQAYRYWRLGGAGNECQLLFNWILRCFE